MIIIGTDFGIYCGTKIQIEVSTMISKYGITLDNIFMGHYSCKRSKEVLKMIKKHMKKYPLRMRTDFNYRIFEMPEK